MLALALAPCRVQPASRAQRAPPPLRRAAASRQPSRRPRGQPIAALDSLWASFWADIDMDQFYALTLGYFVGDMAALVLCLVLWRGYQDIAYLAQRQGRQRSAQVTLPSPTTLLAALLLQQAQQARAEAQQRQAAMQQLEARIQALEDKMGSRANRRKDEEA